RPCDPVPRPIVAYIWDSSAGIQELADGGCFGPVWHGLGTPRIRVSCRESQADVFASDTGNC
ncbi:MAG: hypothetical protein VXZ15_02060, partial [Planctomycetota bacterium]|nr:hypothetical protein [Planctomycetota bacterium]